MNKREQILFVKHGRLFSWPRPWLWPNVHYPRIATNLSYKEAVETNARAPSTIILLHEDPRTVRAPSFNEIKFRAFEHHATATDGTALLRGSDHAFDDFA